MSSKKRGLRLIGPLELLGQQEVGVGEDRAVVAAEAVAGREPPLGDDDALHRRLAAAAHGAGLDVAGEPAGGSRSVHGT